jgi:large subunit ribosomal protein L9
LELVFKAKVGESGKLFGSVTQQMIADAISEKISVAVDRHWVESQPLRDAGEHKVKVRLTFDLIPEVKVIIVSDVEEEEEPEGKPKRARKSEAKAEVVENAEVPSEADSSELEEKPEVEEPGEPEDSAAQDEFTED